MLEINVQKKQLFNGTAVRNCHTDGLKKLLGISDKTMASIIDSYRPFIQKNGQTDDNSVRNATLALYKPYIC